MFSNIFGKFTDSRVAVFALEMGSVILTIVDVSNKGKATIVFVDRRELDLAEADAPKDILRKTCTKIEEMFRDAIAFKSFHIFSNAKVLVLLGLPWNVSSRERIALQKEKPFRLTLPLMQSAIKDKSLSEHPGLSVVSSHLMGINMNGYKIQNPIGKQTSAAELDVFVEMAPDEALHAISNEIDKHLPHADTRFTTTTFANTEAIALRMREKDFILVLPEHSVTEISIVKDGVIGSSASIPFGIATIAKSLFSSTDRQISKEDKMNSKAAAQKVSRFLRGEFDPKSIDKASKAVEELKKSFINAFQNVLWNTRDGVLCPSLVYIAGADAETALMKEWISKEEYASQTLTASCFTVSALRASDLFAPGEAYGKDVPLVSAVSEIAAINFVRSHVFTDTLDTFALKQEGSKVK